MTDNIINEESKKIFKELNIIDKKLSSSWLTKFKKRYYIKYKFYPVGYLQKVKIISLQYKYKKNVQNI